jgi:hypothetical protein
LPVDPSGRRTQIDGGAVHVVASNCWPVETLRAVVPSVE